MAKRPKPKRKTVKGKPGPREDRLAITGDPQVALNRLLNKPKSR